MRQWMRSPQPEIDNTLAPATSKPSPATRAVASTRDGEPR
jgi:hypothetical protein